MLINVWELSITSFYVSFICKYYSVKNEQKIKVKGVNQNQTIK